jgi:hypothetical protein
MGSTLTVDNIKDSGDNTLVSSTGSGHTIASGVAVPAAGVTGTLGSGITFPAGHMIGFGSFTETSGSNITTTGTRELVAETGITMVVKSASSKMLINFFTATAEGDSNRAFFHIRRSINGASATTLRNFGTSEKGHGMSDVDGQFSTVAINDIDTHGQPIGTSIQYYVRLISNGGGAVYWRGAGSNQSGYVMEIQG